MSFDLVQLLPASCCVLLRLAAPTNPYTYSTTVLDPSCKRHASFLTRFVSNPYVSCCFVLFRFVVAGGRQLARSVVERGLDRDRERPDATGLWGNHGRVAGRTRAPNIHTFVTSD